MSQPILETRGLSKAFGGLVALNKVDLAIETGKISAIIGPNGAGKTTLFNVITGVYAATEGEVIFRGRPLSKAMPTSPIRSMPWLGGQWGALLGSFLGGLFPLLFSSGQNTPHQRAGMGIVRTFQNVLLFGNMTVLENVMSGRHPRSGYGFLEAALRLPKAHREEESISLSAMKYLNLVGLGTQAQQNALSLPLGQQKLLAIARALATEPQLLLLDEPGAGLNTLEKQELSDLIRRIREMGITVILVEHDMPLIMGLAEWVIVLDSGQKIAEGTAAQIQRDQRVIAAYLGEEVD